MSASMGVMQLICVGCRVDVSEHQWFESLITFGAMKVCEHGYN